MSQTECQQRHHFVFVKSTTASSHVCAHVYTHVRKHVGAMPIPAVPRMAVAATIRVCRHAVSSEGAAPVTEWGLRYVVLGTTHCRPKGAMQCCH